MIADHAVNKDVCIDRILDEEIIFLSSLMSQINALSSQVLYVSSNIKETWSAIDKIHKNWENKAEAEDL